MEKNYKMKMMTVLGNVAFTPVAGRGRPVKTVEAEAEEYCRRAVSLACHNLYIRHGWPKGKYVHVGESEVVKRPIRGWARTIFFMRMAAWGFGDYFPKFTKEFTSTHFPVAECWIVTTPLEVKAESEEAAKVMLSKGVILRAKSDRTLLEKYCFFCYRLGRTIWAD